MYGLMLPDYGGYINSVCQAMLKSQAKAINLGLVS